jgi:zinc protease
MRYRHRYLWTAALLLVAHTLPGCAPATARAGGGQATDTRAPGAQSATARLAELPIDPEVTVGELANGLRYYIRVNNEPQRRAELRLVVKAGSLQEDEDQRGLAHFVEHMAFNGTQNFQKQELIRYLESIGMRFGADLNASTSFDHTLYQLIVPTDKPEPLETAFKILDDWAQGITFDPDEIEAERGVVLSEWRSRLGVGTRVRTHTDSVLMGQSRFLERHPIGLPEVIQTAGRDAFLRYYRDWYRPDLMAVVVVGDVDKERIESLIRTHFGDLSSPRGARERTRYTLPKHSKALVSVVRDPELTGTRVELVQKYEPKPINSVQRQRAAITQSLFSGILNQRLREISTRSNSPFLGSGTSFGGYVGGLNVHTVVSTTVRDGEIIPGFRAALTEVERIAQHGITQEELEREKRRVESGYTQSLITRSKITSGSYASSYVSHFLSNRTPAALEASVAQSRALLSDITGDEVAALARNWKSRNDLVLVAMLPEKSSVTPPTSEELLAVLDEVGRTRVAAQPSAPAGPASGRAGELMATLPTPGAVVKEQHIPEVGITEWTLANGARVLLKPTDFTPDQVLLSGYSWGGSSLHSDDQLLDLALARSLPALSGLGDLDATGLRNAVVGKILTVGSQISNYSQTVSGNSTLRDLETFLQLVHLHFTGARVDEEAIEAWRARSKTAIEGRAASPEAHFSDSLSLILSQRSPRHRFLTPAALDSIDAGRALAIYQERFADAGDFTFVIVGAFKPDSIRPLVETYLGGLPTRPGSRGWRDTGERRPEGVIEKEFRFGREPRARTAIVFGGLFEHSEDDQYALGATTSVLNMRLRDRLREALGGTYSVSVRPQLSAIPERRYSVQIVFDSAPERADELRAAVFEEIRKLSRSGPTADELTKVREEFARQTELTVRNNNFWAQTILAYDQTERPLALLSRYAESYRNLNAGIIQAMSRQYLSETQFVRVTQLPAQ